MIILTSQDAALVNCCGCDPTACEEPRRECESQEYIANCGDDDYTDALTAWEEATARRETWEAAHDDYVTDHAAWVISHAAWEACEISTPGECGPEPIEPVDPPEPPEPGDEPEIPEGYNDVLHGCYLPFEEPEGAPTDDLPTIYRTRMELYYIRYTGSSWSYLSGAGTYPLSAETLSFGNYVSWPGDAEIPLDYTETANGNEYNEVATTCTPFGPDPITDPDFNLPDDTDIDYGTGTTTNECTADSSKTTVTYTASEGSALELEGCGATTFPETSNQTWDLTKIAVIGYKLGSGITKSDLIARAISNLPDGWEEWREKGSECISSIVADWPTIGESEFPECSEGDYETIDFGTESVATAATVTAVMVRYKVGIPDSDSYAGFDDAHAAWVIAHAAWSAEDPETRGPEPVEPIERSVFEVQWDEVFFPAPWESWKALKDAFDAATLAHDEWDACQAETPGECGTEPTIPADPGTAPTPAPSLVASRSWSYAGTDEFSDWFEIAVPTTEGETRVVNMMVICYHSTRLGVKPTSHGEVYEL